MPSCCASPPWCRPVRPPPPHPGHDSANHFCAAGATAAGPRCSIFKSSPPRGAERETAGIERRRQRRRRRRRAGRSSSNSWRRASTPSAFRDQVLCSFARREVKGHGAREPTNCSGLGRGRRRGALRNFFQQRGGARGCFQDHDQDNPGTRDRVRAALGALNKPLPDAKSYAGSYKEQFWGGGGAVASPGIVAAATQPRTSVDGGRQVVRALHSAPALRRVSRIGARVEGQREGIRQAWKPDGVFQTGNGKCLLVLRSASSKDTRTVRPQPVPRARRVPQCAASGSRHPVGFVAQCSRDPK